MHWDKLLSPVRLKYRNQERSSKRIPGDKRDEFDRDWDRVIFSTPFRRLQDKTQVFPLEPNDSVRTRLTHSLEVSHVAKGLAKDCCTWLKDKKQIDDEQARMIETIAATCGLLHDLGNPPFGHAGELAIREWFEERRGSHFFDGLKKDAGGNGGYRCNQLVMDFLQFEGNAQTIRLISKLQILADFYGLNLTCGTLSAACKYVAASDEISDNHHEKKKPGYFASENDRIEAVRDETATGNARNPITFLVEVADDCAYNIIDLEDGFNKGLLDWSFLKNRLKGTQSGARCIKEAEKRVKRSAFKDNRFAREQALVRYLRVMAIGEIVTATAKAFEVQYEAIMEGDFHGELVMHSSAADLVQCCQEINRRHVYCSRETLKLELMGRKIIHDLMNVFWEGIDLGREDTKILPGRAFALLSHNYRLAFEEASKALPESYCKMRLLTDYISGMTDTYAKDLHAQLTNA